MQKLHQGLSNDDVKQHDVC